MLKQIFWFELRYQFGRPAVYCYFTAVLIFMAGTFATGSLPLAEKQHINAPQVIAFWCAGMSMLLALIGSATMGQAIYRDIEYKTNAYYAAYPITRAGYFWGRFSGAFVIMLLISTAIITGIYLGTLIGPAMGWKDPKQYGPNQLSYYLQPFLYVVLPNVFFTSSLFFSLVMLTRNVKVIYSGGILLFLGYSLSFFFFLNSSHVQLITLADPFLMNGIRFQSNNTAAFQQNTLLIDFQGPLLMNRLIWISSGLILLSVAVLRFSFERFFTENNSKALTEDMPGRNIALPAIKPVFDRTYKWLTLASLVRLELRNLIRDKYFLIIIASGITFLVMCYWIGHMPVGAPEYPRTVVLLAIFSETFPFYLFMLILFYTGEVLNREYTTGYASISDALPPPNWVLNGAKLISLLILGLALALIPVLSAIAVQLAQGFRQFNFSEYGVFLGMILGPRLVEIVIFCYTTHVLIRHKFVGHVIGLVAWLVLFFLNNSGLFTYHLLLYASIPSYTSSDMDGIGHLVRPICWFQLYWLLFGGLLMILSALFYNRGVRSSFKDRLRLLNERFDQTTRKITYLLSAAFICTGGYIYYNVSYLNKYITLGEQERAKVNYEKVLKPFENLPMPKVTNIRMSTALYPDKQQALTHAWVTVTNKTSQLIDRLLIDGDEIPVYNLKTNGNTLTYDSEPMDFRLYHLKQPLLPGDSLVIEVNSEMRYHGFANDAYGQDLLHNGIVLKGGLPGLGYDENDELSDPFLRKKYGLPLKKDSPADRNTLMAGPSAGVVSIDLTVSTSADQTAVAPGTLLGRFSKSGRNYFHYRQTGMYWPFSIFSARYAVKHDTVSLSHPVDIEIFYDPRHGYNIDRFMQAYKDGLHYFSAAFGQYPFTAIRLVENNVYQNKISSLTTLDAYSEDFGWNAHLSSPFHFDYCYFWTARELAQQWWRFQVAPNRAAGSALISEGLSLYSALALEEKKYGTRNIGDLLSGQLGDYFYRRTRLTEKEQPLVRMNDPSQQGKAGVVLYGLRELIGEQQFNVALCAFKEAYAFKNEPPFAGSLDLYSYLEKYTPDSIHYYLEDNFKKITFYDNKVVAARVRQIGKKYIVTLTVEVHKTYGENGREVLAPNMDDLIDIGIFRDHDTVFLKRYRMTDGLHTYQIVVNKRPTEVVIDPHGYLIDRRRGDNTKPVN